MIAARDQRQAFHRRTGGLIVEFHRCTHGGPQRTAPSGEILRRLAVNHVHWQKHGPALGPGRLFHRNGKGAEGRKSPVAKTQDGLR